jgi:hypothetical protein
MCGTFFKALSDREVCIESLWDINRDDIYDGHLIPTNIRGSRRGFGLNLG